MYRQHWLNGWYRGEGSVGILIGSGVHCVCCGKFRGVTCVAINRDWKHPKKLPDWPFPEDDCPICFGKNMPVILTIEELSNYSLSELRQALVILKNRMKLKKKIKETTNV